MLYHWLAACVVLVHGAFIVFVVVGGFLTWRWRWVAWGHVPLAAWGALVEYRSWVCPLTPLENHLRHEAGLAGYGGGFIEHYLLPIIYPAGLTPHIQFVLGTIVVIVNLVAYGVFFVRASRG